jgi:hypothetical protein
MMDTTPISNIVQFEPKLHEQFALQFVLHCSHNHGKAVQRHKAVLGRQNRTFTGYKRYWVWECPQEGWCVYVNNRKGVGFEVYPSLTPQEAMKAWAAYLARFSGPDASGTTPPPPPETTAS